MIDPDKLKCGQIEAKLKLKQLFLIKNVKGNCEKWLNNISHQLCFPNHIHTALGKSNRIKKLPVFLAIKPSNKTGRSGPRKLDRFQVCSLLNPSGHTSSVVEARTAHVTIKCIFDSSERNLIEIGLETHWNATAEDRRDAFQKFCRFKRRI